MQNSTPVAIPGSSVFAQAGQTLTAAINELRKVNSSVKLLALNAKIEAVRAGDLGLPFCIVAQEMIGLSSRTAGISDDLVNRTRTIQEIGETFNGKRVAELALNCIDLVDRNLYERTCDVRWWATDSSFVQALDSPTEENHQFAAKRMGVILNAYTVYFDLVLCDLSGTIVTNGKTGTYSSTGKSVYQTPSFRSAIMSKNGDHYGFQFDPSCKLVNGQPSLIYSCAVRRSGASNGEPLGVLGVVFNWQSLADGILHGKAFQTEEFSESKRYFLDENGQVLASVDTTDAGKMVQLQQYGTLFQKETGFSFDTWEERPSLIAQATSPGFETYKTGWHAVIVV